MPQAPRPAAILVLSILLVATLASVPSAAALPTLVASEPAASAVLTESPARIVLTFSEPLQASGSSLAITGAPGVRVALTDVRFEGAQASAALPPLARGTYEVAYRAAGSDGIGLRGAFGFTIAAPVREPTLRSAGWAHLAPGGAATDPRGAALAWANGSLYALGGGGSCQFAGTPATGTAILRVDPGTGNVTKLAAELPTPRACASVFSDDDAVYLAGGRAERSFGDILRYDAANGTLRTMGARVAPEGHGLHGAAVAWTGRVAYLFGGMDCAAGGVCTYLDGVARYDPVADAVTPMRATLPFGMVPLAATWAQTRAYVLVAGAAGATLLAYDPEIDAFNETPAAFSRNVSAPMRFAAASLAWEGDRLTLLSGTQAWELDPREGEVTRLSTKLPLLLEAAAWRGEEAHVLVGNGSGAPSLHLVQYDPRAQRGGLAFAPLASNATIAAWDGSRAVVFDQAGGEILRVDARNGSVARAAAGARVDAGARAIGVRGDVFLFGGERAEETPTGMRLVREPAIGRVAAGGLSLATTRASIPGGRAGGALATDGRSIYVFGGVRDDAERGGSIGDTDAILRFDPAADALVELDAKLPAPTDGTSAVWDGSAFYVFGGRNTSQGDGVLDTILRVDPESGAVRAMRATLPTARRNTIAVWAGNAAYVIGGYDGRGLLDEIVRYDPANDTVTPVAARAPAPLEEGSALWTGEEILLFTREGILRYTPPPTASASAPLAPTASPSEPTAPGPERERAPSGPAQAEPTREAPGAGAALAIAGAVGLALARRSRR